MKALGGLLVILSGLFLGLWTAAGLRRREEALLDLKRTIQAFRTGISFAARPLPELVMETKDSRFCRAAENRLCLRDPRGALEQAGEGILRDSEDLALYRRFVRGLGETDTQGQLEHFQLCEALLEGRLAEAGKAREQKTRLYVCLGLFGGVTLCLVLL